MSGSNKVLLLNASWEPIRVIGVTRAMVLLIQGKAELVEPVEGEYVRSANQVFAMPSVIRLKYMVKIPYNARVALNRRAVLARDNYECQYGCGRRATTMDHVHPRSKGGKHEWTNVVGCCPKCNSKKADHLLEDTNFKLIRQPQVPRGAVWIIANAHKRPEWEPYLSQW